MAIPGTGNDVFSTTSARDVAKATAEQLKSKNKWRPYTYVRAIKTTWLQLDELVKTVGVVSDLKVSFEPVDEIKAALEKQGSKFSALLAEFKMLVQSGRCQLSLVNYSVVVERRGFAGYLLNASLGFHRTSTRCSL
ncbi:putative F420-dependent NADP reductase [Phytophthora infestans]|uniref:Putative F420-dependent NADP reductase n=1 Tax=Phytophthora infestans TaxID=4787 RepID=A0A833T8P2_PHYIN|nr:putative F420-dependent NADP reductase [Phytophthora infestans]KAI9983542.1 hypothetical protein PInf_007607 [Phytophthora infestans]